MKYLCNGGVSIRSKDGGEGVETREAGRARNSCAQVIVEKKTTQDGEKLQRLLPVLREKAAWAPPHPFP